MKVIIVGCGQMGSELASALCSRMHDVTVIDNTVAAFDLLPPDFSGKTIAGVGFDKGILKQAGIESADGLIACSRSDTINALVSHIACTFFHVPFVLARLYNSQKAETYNTLGVQTISATGYGVERAIKLLEQNRSDTNAVLNLENGAKIFQFVVSDQLNGKKVSQLQSLGEISLVAIGRGDRTYFPGMLEEFLRGDTVFVAASEGAEKKLKFLLDDNKH